jgi:hypothetical protein
MSAQQPITDELRADHVRFELEARGEPAMNSAGRSHEIKIDESHRVLSAPASSDCHIFYVALIVGLLATFGLAWIILNGSASPFDLTSMGGSAGNRSLNLEQSSNAPSAPIPDTQKVNGPQIHNTVVREGRDAPTDATQIPNPSATTSIGAPLSPPTSKQSTAAQWHTALTGAKPEKLRTSTKLTRTPETGPTTIKGWTLREVTNGTAVLEGPNGVWRAKPGQTVPGVGRLDSIVRWGNRLIVATSSGLISTP